MWPLTPTTLTAFFHENFHDHFALEHLVRLGIIKYTKEGWKTFHVVQLLLATGQYTKNQDNKIWTEFQQNQVKRTEVNIYKCSAGTMKNVKRALLKRRGERTRKKSSAATSQDVITPTGSPITSTVSLPVWSLCTVFSSHSFTGQVINSYAAYWCYSMIASFN